MENTLNISTGTKRIAINRDGVQEDYLEFNPSDIDFAERFYSLLNEFDEKLAEYNTRAQEIEKNKELDSSGVPANAKDYLVLIRETCEFVHEKIDKLFGKGTSQKVFGNSMVLDTLSQFFEGITPFVQVARTEKMKKYQHHDTSKVMK